MNDKIKKVAKKILKRNVNIIRSTYDEDNFSGALKNLTLENPDLLLVNSHIGKRKDGKKYYKDISKIADGFNFINNDLIKLGRDNVPDIYEYDGFHSGTPLKYKPFKPCIDSVRHLLTKKNLYTYQSTTGDNSSKEKIVEYLKREGFKLEKDSNYDGLGADNIAFICSTTQAFTAILNTIMRDEDAIIMTGPNYGLFALEPERLNGRVVILPLKKEDDWYVNPKELSKLIDKTNKELEKEFKGKLDYVPRVKAFLNMNPHNPMGRVMNYKNKDLLYEIGDICLEKNVFVIDDLIYRDLTFDDDLALPLATNTKYFNNTISFFGLSKAYGLASFRAGFVVAPIPVIRGISNEIFENMDSIPTPQIAAIIGGFNGSDGRYKKYNKYFDGLLKEYKYQYNFFLALLNGIDTIKNTKLKNRIINEFHKYSNDDNLLKGIKDVNLVCNVDSGFFAVLNFTKLKGKKYKDITINKDMDLLKYLYIRGKMKMIMGYNMSWPNDDEIIARVNFAVPIKALINNFRILNYAIKDLK